MNFQFSCNMWGGGGDEMDLHVIGTSSIVELFFCCKPSPTVDCIEELPVPPLWNSTFVQMSSNVVTTILAIELHPQIACFAEVLKF